MIFVSALFFATTILVGLTCVCVAAHAAFLILTLGS